jgi:hypothetical protein
VSRHINKTADIQSTTISHPTIPSASPRAVSSPRHSPLSAVYQSPAAIVAALAPSRRTRSTYLISTTPLTDWHKRRIPVRGDRLLPDCAFGVRDCSAWTVLRLLGGWLGRELDRRRRGRLHYYEHGYVRFVSLVLRVESGWEWHTFPAFLARWPRILWTWWVWD